MSVTMEFTACTSAQVLGQHMIPSMWRLFQGRPWTIQQFNCVLYLLQQHDCLESTPGVHTWSPRLQRGRSEPTKNIWSIMKLKAEQTQDCWAARILYQTRMGNIFSPKSPAAALLSAKTFREEAMLHSGKHWPVLTFLSCVAATKFKMSQYVSLKTVHYLSLNIW